MRWPPSGQSPITWAFRLLSCHQNNSIGLTLLSAPRSTKRQFSSRCRNSLIIAQKGIAMLSDVRNYYGFARDFGQAGYFETEHSEQIVRELKLEIKAGKLVALSGIVGCGKTTMLRRIQEALSQDKEILASKSLSLEKSQISLATLIMALFYDLATEKDFKIPTQPERRERALRDLIRKRQKPIAL